MNCATHLWTTAVCSRRVCVYVLTASGEISISGRRGMKGFAMSIRRTAWVSILTSCHTYHFQLYSQPLICLLKENTQLITYQRLNSELREEKFQQGNLFRVGDDDDGVGFFHFAPSFIIFLFGNFSRKPLIMSSAQVVLRNIVHRVHHNHCKAINTHTFSSHLITLSTQRAL